MCENNYKIKCCSFVDEIKKKHDQWNLIDLNRNKLNRINIRSYITIKSKMLCGRSNLQRYGEAYNEARRNVIPIDRAETTI